jgi:hypothetical protein
MYAAVQEVKKSLSELKDSSNAKDEAYQRSMFQPCEIFCGTFWPTLMFVYIVACNLGKWRYTASVLIIFLSLVVPLGILFWYSRRMYQSIRRDTARRWKLVMCTVLWFTTLWGIVTADKAYQSFAKGFYDFQAMASYINIDPTNDRGQTFMDAGQVYFKEGTRVDVEKAIAFKENNIYCAAPIVQQTLDAGGVSTTTVPGGAASGNTLTAPASGTMDFWAVGIDCCQPSGLDFKCGESRNQNARAGIRTLRDDTRPFYLMAVQEWTAQYKIPAKHPLFFHWVQDPLLEVDNFLVNAYKLCAIDLVFVLCGAVLGNLFLHFTYYNCGFIR